MSAKTVSPSPIRFRVQPRDVPPVKAARKLHLTLAEFNRLREGLHARGFPQPDETTGNYDLRAIERWMDARSNLAEPLTAEPKPRDPAQGFADRVARLANGQR